MEQIRNFLQNYASLSDEEWNLLLTKTSVYRLKAGEFLLTEGKVCNFIGFVESGVLRTYYVDKLGNEKSMFFHFKKLPISDFESFINRKPSKCYIQSMIGHYYRDAGVSLQPQTGYTHQTVIQMYEFDIRIFLKRGFYF